MEWKEDVFKGTILGVATLIGHWILKTVKKKVEPLQKMYSCAADFEKIKENAIVQGLTYDAFIEINRNPIYFTDADGGMTYANTAWLELTGFTNIEDAFGMGYMRAISDEDQQGLMDMHDAYVNNPHDTEGICEFIHLKTKEKTLCRYRNRVIRINGKFIKGIGILEIIKN